MKLIIDIPELDYECAKQRWMRGNDAHKMDYYISKGTPLDDVRAEIKKEYDIEAQNHDTFDDYSDGRYDAFSACLKIIDKYLADMRGE